MSRKTLSASGARIRGDDYQHLFAWYQILRALQQGSGITAIGIEDHDPAAGNADDVTVYRSVAQNEFYQVKSSVDAKQLVNCQWLTAPSRSSGPSILQGLYKAWQHLSRDNQSPKLSIVTNRLIDPADPIVILRDGKDGTVARQLREAQQGSVAANMRRELADHLHINEIELITFLKDLRFEIGKLYKEWEEYASILMCANGFKYDGKAVQIGVNTVHDWVADGKRMIPLEEILDKIESLNLRVAEPAAIFLVQAIDHDPMPETATVALDWINLYQGSEPRNRRKLYDNELWNKQLRFEIQQAKSTFRATGLRRVLVRGYMRLPAWFLIGSELGKTAGFDVATLQGGREWSSEGEICDFPVSLIRNEELGIGGDLAIGVSVSVDLSQDVLSYLASHVPSVGRYICFVSANGPNSRAILNAAEARGWASTLGRHVRDIVRQYRPNTLHVFLATPKGAALLLGHEWDRMLDTQLYEDQGISGGYLPSFFLPN